MSLGPLMIDLRGTEVTDTERHWLRHPAVGGVILFRRNFRDLEQLRALVEDIHGVRTPELLVAVDQEGGRVQRFLEPFTALPPMRALGRCHDAEGEKAIGDAKAFGWLMAAELRSVGVDLSFAPVVDVDRGLCDVIGDRAIHGQEDVVSRLAQAFMQGMDAAGMASVAKHFPTHSGVTADSHTELAIDRREFEALLDDLMVYERLIRGGLHGVMVAHVSFPSVDPRPAGFSSWWLGVQLRGELRFGGAIFSDDLSMAGAGGVGGMTRRVDEALGAGCDMVLLCNDPDAVPPVLDHLEGFSDPSAQLRLVRLRGRGSVSWEDLRASQAWKTAVARVEGIGAPPPLSLEG